MFEDLKYFDAQNPVIGNLIKKTDIGKKKDLSKTLKGALGIIDLELRLRLNRLRDDETFNPDSNNNNNNNNNNSDNNNNNDNNHNLLPPPPPSPPPPPNFGPNQLHQPPPSPTNFLDQNNNLK